MLLWLTPSLPQYVKFPGLMMHRHTSDPITSTFKAMHFDENPFTCQCEKEVKQAEKFQIVHFYGSFLNDIMTVKGLNRT